MKREILRRVTGYALIGAVWLALAGVLGCFALTFSIYRDLKSPDRSRLVAGTPVEGIAHMVYSQNFWAIWQADLDCAQFDPQLIYVPKPGVARFQTPEFDTRITMTPDGLRQQPDALELADGDLIVMAGDSHTMGWGVGDTETFSAVLQSRFHRRTVNSGVSSYGTARELLRLRRLGLLARAKLLVIQYCPNDAPENQEFLRLGNGRTSTRDPRATWEAIKKAPVNEVSYWRVLGGTIASVRERLKQQTMREFARDLHRGTLRLSRRYDQTFPKSAEEFLAVLDQFPELAGKPILVTEMKAPDEPSHFLEDLRGAARGRRNLRVVTLDLPPADFFRFDPHLRARGHEKVAAQLDRAIRDFEADLGAGEPAH